MCTNNKVAVLTLEMFKVSSRFPDIKHLTSCNQCIFLSCMETTLGLWYRFSECFLKGTELCPQRWFYGKDVDKQPRWSGLITPILFLYKVPQYFIPVGLLRPALVANKGIAEIVLAQRILFSSSEHVWKNNFWKFLPENLNCIDNIM